MKNYLRGEHGNIMITALVSIGVVTAGVFTMSSYVVRLYKTELSRFVNKRVSRIQQSLMSIVRNDASWTLTISNNDNIGARFSCLSTKTCDSTYRDFSLFDSRGLRLTNPHAASAGLSLDGEPCETFSLDNPYSRCPVRFEFQWVADCQTCVFQTPKVIGKLLFSYPDDIPFNQDIYSIDFARGKETATVGETCASMKGLLDSVTGVCKLPFAGVPCAAAKSMNGTLSNGQVNCSISPGLGKQECPPGTKPIGANPQGEIICAVR